MNIDEIIKALECCKASFPKGCVYCPEKRNKGCIERLARNALDFIRRQQLEIDRLNKEVDRLSQCVLYHDGQMVDTIKEFAQELKDRTSVYSNAGNSDFIQGCIETVDWFDSKIDELVKEMGCGDD